MIIKTPTIRTKDFILRPMTLVDARDYLELHQDNEAKKNFMSVPKNLAEAKKEIANDLKDSKFFAIELDNKCIGFVHLRLNKNPRYRHSAIIGYGLNLAYRGRGIVTKAVKLVTDYGFKRLRLVRISGWCRTFNKASARVLEKCGYKLEGILRKNKCKNGKYLDDMVWAIVK
jgi:RimJ/RimL family protein N-acetyltransferase